MSFNYFYKGYNILFSSQIDIEDLDSKLYIWIETFLIIYFDNLLLSFFNTKIIYQILIINFIMWLRIYDIMNISETLILNYIFYIYLTFY